MSLTSRPSSGTYWRTQSPCRRQWRLRSATPCLPEASMQTPQVCFSPLVALLDKILFTMCNLCNSSGTCRQASEKSHLKQCAEAMLLSFDCTEGGFGHRCRGEALDAAFAHEPTSCLAFICMGNVHDITLPLQCCFTMIPYNAMTEQVTAYHTCCNMADIAQHLQADLQQPCLCGSSSAPSPLSLPGSLLCLWRPWQTPATWRKLVGLWAAADPWLC